MIDRPTTTSSLRQLLAVAFRHKKKIVAFSLLALSLGALVLVFGPRTYRSEAKLFLRVGRESVGLDPTATIGQTMGMQQADRKDEVKSAIDVLSSRDVIAKAVDRIGPDVVLGRSGIGAAKANAWMERLRKPVDAVAKLFKSIDPISDREEAIFRAEGKLDVMAERDSTVVQIGFKARTPQLAQAVCDAIVQVYQQEHLRIYRNEESRHFFTQQRNRLRQQLDDALAAVRTAKNEMGLSNVDERRSTLETQYAAVEIEKYSTRQQLATTKAHVAELASQLAKLPQRLVSSQKSVPNQGADLLRDKLYELELKVMDLEARYSDAHPLVQAVKLQLDEAQQVIAGQAEQRLETTDAVNPIHRQLSLELKQQSSALAGLEARLAELERQKATVLADLRDVNEYALKIDQLQRQADIARVKFFQYAQNLEEAHMDRELAEELISNVSVLQPATFAERPVSPNKLLVLMATLVVATAGTAAVVVACEQLDDRLRSDDDVARELELPVLGSIPGDRLHRRVLAMQANGLGKASIEDR